jgi:hypothetical protein
MLSSILSTIFGSGEVISKGMELIDDIHYSPSEEAEDIRKNESLKTRNKIDLMKSYAPFKVAQRYLAIMFTINFILVFWMFLILVFADRELDKVREIVSVFYLGEIQLAIIAFYFGGGFADSIYQGKKGLSR